MQKIEGKSRIWCLTEKQRDGKRVYWGTLTAPIAAFSKFQKLRIGKVNDASYTDQRGYLYLAMAVRLGCVKLA